MVQAEGRRLSGYAAVFNQPTEIRDKSGRAFVEVIRPGAFAGSLNQDIWAKINHDARIVRSKSGALALAEDSHGLRFDLTLPDTSRNRDLAAEIAAGVYGGMSFGAKVRRDRWSYDRQPSREILSADLAEISVVYDPAYTGTSVELRSIQIVIPDLVLKMKLLELLRT